MGHTLFLCSVAILAGTEGQVYEQTVPTKPCASCQARMQGQSSSGPLGLGIWDRMRYRVGNMFGGGSNHQFEQRPTLMETAPPPLAEPELPSSNVTPSERSSYSEPPLFDAPTINVGFQTAQPDAKAAIPSTPSASSINAKFIDKIGHEDDYSWVTGQLGRRNGQWFIEYAGPHTVDAYHGKLVLANVGDMKNVEVGDLVNVVGSLTSSNGRPNGAYRMTNIYLIERGR